MINMGDPDFNDLMKKIGLDRLFLHAKSLTFTNPTTKEIQKVIAPLHQSLRISKQVMNDYFRLMRFDKPIGNIYFYGNILGIIFKCRGGPKTELLIILLGRYSYACSRLCDYDYADREMISM
jgi:hypothetical protein